MAEQDERKPVEQMTDEEKAEYCRRREQGQTKAAETVRIGAEIVQALWDEGRRIVVAEARYAPLLLLVEMNIYMRLLRLAQQGWVAGWELTGPERTELRVMSPGGTAAVVGSPTLAAGAWMVLRETPTTGMIAPEGGEPGERAV